MSIVYSFFKFCFHFGPNNLSKVDCFINWFIIMPTWALNLRSNVFKASKPLKFRAKSPLLMTPVASQLTRRNIVYVLFVALMFIFFLVSISRSKNVVNNLVFCEDRCCRREMSSSACKRDVFFRELDGSDSLAKSELDFVNDVNKNPISELGL